MFRIQDLACSLLPSTLLIQQYTAVWCSTNLQCAASAGEGSLPCNRALPTSLQRTPHDPGTWHTILCTAVTKTHYQYTLPYFSHIKQIICRTYPTIMLSPTKQRDQLNWITLLLYGRGSISDTGRVTNKHYDENILMIVIDQVKHVRKKNASKWKK